MKKILFYILTAATICISVSSCTSTLPGRFERFVNSVERNYENFSEDDWNEANAKFEKLFDEYKENRSSFNSEEKSKINSALARYAKVVAKSGIQSIGETFDEIASQIPGIIEDAKSFFHELGVTLGIDE